MIYDFMDDHNDYYTWLLENIYLYLGDNIVNSINMKYSEISIMRSYIPDFIIGNEIFFINHNSTKYKTFVSKKITHFFSNEHEYKIVPICIIWLKLCKLFSSYSLMIMYNRLLDAIKYFPYEICYNNYKYLEKPKNKILVSENEVFSSCLFDAYENFQLNEFLCLYIKKIFGMKNYKLLNSELDFLDIHNLSKSKFDNLKYLVFRTGLTQWQLRNKTDMLDFSQIINLDIQPNYNSIRFSLFISWALSQKILSKNISQISYIEDTTLNINKLYNYFIYLINDNTGLFTNIIKWIKNFNWDEYDKTISSEGCDNLKLLDSFDVNTIFDLNNCLYKVYYDYPTNPIIKIKDVVGDSYIIEKLTNKIEQNIYDNIDYLENDLNEIEDNLNETENDNIETNSFSQNLSNQKSSNQKGGNNKILGIYKLENELGKIISTVPICKISNIIQFIK